MANIEEKSGVTARPPRHKPDDYRSSLLDLLGLSHPYERAVTQVRSDIVITRPAPSEEVDSHFPRIAELQRPRSTAGEPGTEGLVQRLWNATEAAEHDLVLEDWGPESPLDRSVGRYRWAWWPVLLGILVIGIVLVISSLRGIPAGQAEDLGQEWATATITVQASVPSAREAAAVITNPASATTELAEARNSLIGFSNNAGTLQAIVSRPFPTPPPLASGDAFDALKPIQTDLKVASDQVTAIGDTLSDGITYRSLLDQSFLLPSLPIVADQVTLTDLGVQLAASVSSTRAAVRQLPIGPSFDSHRNRALALVNRLETWQASYLDALRLADVDAATELKTEITNRIGVLRATVNEPLALVAASVDASFDELEILFEDVVADLTAS